MQAIFPQYQTLNNFQTPMSINDFELIKTLGQGAYSKVSMARYKNNGGIYVIKALNHSLFKSEYQEIDFLREKEILYELTKRNHPHVVKLYADFQDIDSRYLVFEFIEGISLNNLKGSEQNKGYLEQNLIINILMQSLETLKYLHETCYIMHRDINPTNIILGKDYNIKIKGFGLSAYLVNQNKVLVSNRSLKGAIKYAAPEIIFAPPPLYYDYKIDIFSLGFTIYSLMNPSLSNKPNLPLITKGKYGIDLKRYENNLINNFYDNWLKDFVKLLYENNQKKRLSASQALEILKMHIKK